MFVVMILDYTNLDFMVSHCLYTNYLLPLTSGFTRFSVASLSRSLSFSFSLLTAAESPSSLDDLFAILWSFT